MKELTLLERKKGICPQHGGAVTGGCFLFIILIGLLGYIGFKVGEAYWNYFEVRQKIRETLNWAVAGSAKPELQIAQKVIANARAAGVELSAQSIQIQQTTDTLTIIASWGREVEFPYYTLPLTFTVSLTEEKRWHKGGLVIK